MPPVQIMCINKTPRVDPYHSITHVGGFVTSAWKLTLVDAIDQAERGLWQFYVHQNGRSVWVEVHTAPSGRKYLKTQDDGYTPDNLLALPECP